MILEIARAATEGVGDGPVELILPRTVITEADARKRIESGDPDALTQFVEGLIGEDLREGFTVSLGSQQQGGITVRVAHQNVEIDLTEGAISDLLCEHLLPRFRAVMRKAQID